MGREPPYSFKHLVNLVQMFTKLKYMRISTLYMMLTYVHATYCGEYFIDWAYNVFVLTMVTTLLLSVHPQ